jgi:hypothetical protein
MLFCAALSDHVLKRGEAHVHYIADVYAQNSFNYQIYTQQRISDFPTPNTV